MGSCPLLLLFPIFLYKERKTNEKETSKTHWRERYARRHTHTHDSICVCVNHSLLAAFTTKVVPRTYTCVNTSCCPGQSVAIGYHSFKSEDRMNSKTRKNKQTKVHSSFAQHSLTLSHGGYKKNHTHLLWTRQSTLETPVGRVVCSLSRYNSQTSSGWSETSSFVRRCLTHPPNQCQGKQGKSNVLTNHLYTQAWEYKLGERGLLGLERASRQKKRKRETEQAQAFTCTLLFLLLLLSFSPVLSPLHIRGRGMPERPAHWHGFTGQGCQRLCGSVRSGVAMWICGMYVWNGAGRGRRQEQGEIGGV